MKVPLKGRHVGKTSPDWANITFGVIIGAVAVMMLVMDRSAVEIAAVVPMMGTALGKLRQPRHRAIKQSRSKRSD